MREWYTNDNMNRESGIPDNKFTGISPLTAEQKRELDEFLQLFGGKFRQPISEGEQAISTVAQKIVELTRPWVDEAGENTAHRKSLEGYPINVRGPLALTQTFWSDARVVLDVYSYPKRHGYRIDTYVFEADGAITLMANEYEIGIKDRTEMFNWIKHQEFGLTPPRRARMDEIEKLKSDLVNSTPRTL